MPTTKPNIIWVMADDMGFGDVGCYNLERDPAEQHKVIDAHPDIVEQLTETLSEVT